MGAFAGHSVCHPCDNQLVPGVRKCARRLRTTMAERFFRGVPAVAVRNRFSPVSIGIHNETKSVIQRVAKSLIVQSFSVALCKQVNRLRPQIAPSCKFAAIQEHPVKTSKLAHGPARARARPADLHPRSILQRRQILFTARGIEHLRHALAVSLMLAARKTQP